MNAIQFIKDHGVEKARRVVEGAPEWAKWWCVDKQKYLDFIPCSNCVDFSDLKRLVDSVDLVNEKGGYVLLKGLVERGRALANFLEKGNEKMSPQKLDTKNLIRCEQAIADYEAIYSGAES